jgi:hypothetical protein
MTVNGGAPGSLDGGQAGAGASSMSSTIGRVSCKRVSSIGLSIIISLGSPACDAGLSRLSGRQSIVPIRRNQIVSPRSIT